MLFSEQTPEELPCASDLQYCHSVNNNQNRAASKKGMTAVGAMAAYLERSWRAEFALKAVAAIHGDSIETEGSRVFCSEDVAPDYSRNIKNIAAEIQLMLGREQLEMDSETNRNTVGSKLTVITESESVSSEKWSIKHSFCNGNRNERSLSA